jgi:hypothetical protein
VFATGTLYDESAASRVKGSYSEAWVCPHNSRDQGRSGENLIEVWQPPQSPVPLTIKSYREAKKRQI